MYGQSSIDTLAAAVSICTSLLSSPKLHICDITGSPSAITYPKVTLLQLLGHGMDRRLFKQSRSNFDFEIGYL